MTRYFRLKLTSIGVAAIVLAGAVNLSLILFADDMEDVLNPQKPVTYVGVSAEDVASGQGLQTH